MKNSLLKETNPTRDFIDAFGGYNHNLRISENEFYDMKNMTGDYFPVLSPRKNRGVYAYPSSDVAHKPNGLISKDALCYVDGNYLYVNNAKVTGLTLTDTPKQLVSMGAYIVIFPDKKYYNTQKPTDFGSIEASFSATTNTVTYTLCDVDANEYAATEGTTPPETPTNMQYWIDTSQTPNILKQYSSVNEMWVEVPTTYIKIACDGIAASFNQYDGVMISGVVSGGQAGLDDINDKVSVIQKAYHNKGDQEGQNVGVGDYIVVVGILNTTTTQTGTAQNCLVISRTMPNMDFVIESGNRLWGCRYGTDSQNNVVNEIYASKLGDFKNWNCFMGISTDSYSASVGTDGQFTGAITHLGYPIFFKENFLHKVYGNFPANYQIQTTACKGVMKGAGKSLAIVNETLFYKSRNGVCIYDGSLPSEISSNFGEIHYSAVDTASNDIAYILRAGAVAGAHQNKYYISMKSEVDNQWYLFIYDTKTGMWHKQDNTHALDFCSCRDELYYIDNTTIKTMLGSGTMDTSKTDWMVETGIITYPYVKGGARVAADNKYISKLNVRMSLELGSTVKFFAKYDSHDVWEHLYTMTGTTLRSFTVPIRPKRCDYFKLRIEGMGPAKIYSIAKTIEQGSDI